MNIQDAINRLISFRLALNYSMETLKSMQSNLKTFSDYLEANEIIDTSQINFQTLMNFQQFIGSLDLSIGAKNQKIFATRALLKFLNERGEGIRGASMLKPLRMPTTIPKTINKDEVDRLFSVIDDKRDLLIASLMFWSGLRVSEVHKLNTFDIDFENRTLLVQGKGNRERLAVFPVHVKALLVAYLSDVRINYPRSLEDSALFLSLRGNRYSIRAIQSMIERNGKLSGVQDALSPHWLRRSFATYCIQEKKDLNIMILAKFLGHQSLSTLKHYARFEVDDLRELLDEIMEK